MTKKTSDKKAPKFVIQTRIPRKRFSNSLNYKPGQFDHPIVELFDPATISNSILAMYQAIDELSIEITGEYLSKDDMPKLKELVEFLITEIRLAAKDTKVENLPAFALNHFKKKLS